MKSGSFRGPPRKKIYRSYKRVDFECFNTALKTKLDSIKGPTYNEFSEAFCSVLNIHVPLEVKMLRQAIMKRSRLKNLFNKQRTHENWVNCKMQQNHCVNLLKKTKKNHFTNLNIKGITDSKTFWKTNQSNFNEKGSSSIKIMLSEKGSILNDNKKPYKCSDSMNINEIISTFDNHISIKKIKEYFPDASNNNFEFTEVSQDEVKKEVLHLNV